MTGVHIVEWIPLSGLTPQVGDIVSADAGGMPTDEVLAVTEDGKAWLKDSDHVDYKVLPVNSLRWKAATGA